MKFTVAEQGKCSVANAGTGSRPKLKQKLKMQIKVFHLKTKQNELRSVYLDYYKTCLCAIIYGNLSTVYQTLTRT